VLVHFQNGPSPASFLGDEHWHRSNPLIGMETMGLTAMSRYSKRTDETLMRKLRPTLRVGDHRATLLAYVAVILRAGETNDFTAFGGVIGFKREGTRVHIRIDVQMAEQAILRSALNCSGSLRS
jgi:hypothetical protein